MTQETYSAAQLADILALHRKWLNGEADGKMANLRGSDLRGSDLRGSDLRNSDLRGSDLRGSDLSNSDLRGSDLRGSNLRGSNGLDAKTISRMQIVPESGAFEGFKLLYGGTVARVRIPAEAARLGGLVGRKCRAEFVEVLEGEGSSRHDPGFRYEVGRVVKPDSFDPDPRVECSHGIHFFLTRIEAEEYR